MSTRTQTTPDITYIKTFLNTIYNYYIISPNKQSVLPYLEDISGTPDRNFFDITTIDILNLKIPKTSILNGGALSSAYLFIQDDGNAIDKDNKDRYNRILKGIEVFCEVLKDILQKNPNDYINKYNSIRYVKYNQLTDSTSGVIQITTLLKYKLDETKKTLDIYYNNTNYPISDLVTNKEFDKLTYSIINSNTAKDIEILHNYIYFLLNIEQINLNITFTSFYYFIQILLKYYEFYINGEKYIRANSHPLCNSGEYFSIISGSATPAVYKYQQGLTTLNSGISSIISNVTQDIILKGRYHSTITDVCPVTLEIKQDDTNNIFANSTDFKLEYIIEKNYIDYDILEATRTPTSSTSTTSKLTTLKLRAKKPTGSCNSEYNPLPSITFEGTEGTDWTDIKLKSKGALELKSKYLEIGTNLQSRNEEIRKSKDKINTQAKRYDAQQGILKALDLRQNIYYGIFAVLIVCFIVLLFVDMQQSAKVYISFIIAVVLLIMNLVNYFLKYDYIEQFSNNIFETFNVEESPIPDTIACNESGISIQGKIQKIHDHSRNFLKEIKSIFETLISILKQNTNDQLLKKLTSSLDNEKRTYDEYANIYSSKQDINKKTIDIMKHEMVVKSGYINLLTISFFVIALVVILYIVQPYYLNIYLLIGFILLVINIAIYYIVVLHPVRTRAKNKYWVKPSNQTITSL
jgi:hypothetical protein